MKMHEIVAYLYFITVSHAITILSIKPIQQKKFVQLTKVPKT
jgi:hypothetical protein